MTFAAVTEMSVGVSNADGLVSATPSDSALFDIV
jgi:hypothetical protein